jgi:hypothetical protein
MMFDVRVGVCVSSGSLCVVRVMPLKVFTIRVSVNMSGRHVKGVVYKHIARTMRLVW